ncbi:unnamed protein product [Paramecium pentaurelia]|uniref:RBR-type E3 ubiquitin transferase n=1 Tax=Paramecium pentaurelia TaxID=43138 RepID=A0A8S1X9H9_9CILI|nr:unnamed protein product [Paramecium pentaurelia]
MFECPICLITYDNNQAFTFPSCFHTFCKNCLKLNFENKIKEQNISLDTFKCPGCEKLFDQSLIQNFVSEQIFKKYCELSIEMNQIFGLEENEILTNCLNETCREKYIIWKNAEYQNCIKCKMQYCRLCFLPQHKNERTCEEQKIMYQDKVYQDLKVLLKASRCPKCRVMVEKVAGCNFMTCRCGTNFCNICDIQLEKQDHYSHFEGNSPFNNKCKIKVNGQWVTRPVVKEVQKVEIKKVIQAEVKAVNHIPCPNCNSTNPKITQLQLFDIIVHCNSVKCQNRAYCLTCKKMVPHQQILNHYTNTLECKFK